ncbi:MAG: MFS transporter [Acidimicrobiales bacterium]
MEAAAKQDEQGRALWRDTDFLKFWAGESTGSLGEQISLLALPLAAILLLRASPFQVGLLTALETVPFILVGLPAGVWLERVRRRPVLVASGLGRAAVLATVPIAWAMGWMTLPYLDVVALLMGALTTFFDIAWQSYLPGLVGTPRLHEANARLMTSSSGARLAGPGLAGILVGGLSAPLALLADSLGFVVTAACVTRIKRPEPPAAAASGARLGPQVREGLHYVTRHRLLRWTATATGCFNAVGMALNVVLVLFEARVLHLSAGMIGLVFMLGNIGFVLGALAVRPITARLGVGPTMVVAAASMAVAPALFPLAHAAAAVPVLVGGWFLRALGSPVFNTNQVSLRLAITPEPLLARMTATMKFFVMGAMPVGSLVAGYLGSVLGLRSTLWVVAAFAVVPFLAVSLSDVRTLRTAPEDLRPPAEVDPAEDDLPARPPEPAASPAA